VPAVQQVAKINRELQRLGMGKLSDPKLFDQMAFLVRDHDHFRGMLMHETQEVRNQMYQCLAPRLRFKALPLDVYEAQSKRIAEEKQLPQYNPSNLECREIRPYHVKSEEFRAQEQGRREAEAFVSSMQEPSAATGVCSGCGKEYARAYLNNGKLAPNDGRCHLCGPAPRSVLDEVAEKSIARDLREAGSNYQLTLVCSRCTFEQKIRVKRKPSAYKLAKQDGWTFPEQGKKALCFACSKSRLN
jgi:hypothetical protein